MAAPTANPASLSILEDQSYVFGLSDFGYSGDNPIASVIISTIPGVAKGVLQLNDGNGNWTSVKANTTISADAISSGYLKLVPVTYYNGSLSFKYKVSDGVTTSTAAFTSTVAIAPVDNASVLAADNAILMEDSVNAYKGNVLSNDRDVDSVLSVTSFKIGDVTTTVNPGATATSYTITNVGTFTMLQTGAYTFKPAPNWNGDVPQITYFTNTNASSTLNIHVTAVNDGPTAQAISLLSLIHI